MALGLISMGGLGVAKMFGNFAGALMILPILLITACWVRILREEGGHALKYCSRPQPEDEIRDRNVPPFFLELEAAKPEKI